MPVLTDDFAPVDTFDDAPSLALKGEDKGVAQY